MAVSAYRRFTKTINRITVLYEVTVDSYRLLYDSGRERLRKEDVATATHEIRLQDRKTRKRPLTQLTFHARDVYPQLLRSTLLIRLVAAYEAFLTDTLREVADRSSEFLKSDQHLDFSQEHLLTLAEEKSVEQFILNKTLRSLTSGGFKEIVRFYGKMSIDVAPPGVPLRDLEEIHDRRHLYVHLGGTADEQYCNKYPTSGAFFGALLPVDEAYLLSSIKQFEDSARHVQELLDARFPESQWVYTQGLQQLSNGLEYLNLFSGKVNNTTPLDFSLILSDGLTRLESLIIWLGRREKEFKLLIGGNAAQASLYSKHMHLAEINGNLVKVVSEKLLR